MKKEETLDTWLERNFPNQFVIDRNLRDIHPKHFYEHKNTAIVASKEDPLVQFEITWYKTMENLGITTEEIIELATNRKRDIEKARKWHAALKAAGLDRFSVGVIDMALYVLPYGEPDPKTRLHYVTAVLQALDQGTDPDQTSIYIECMEDSAYQKELGDIIPFGYWRRKDTYHDDNTIVKLDFEYSKGQEAADLDQYWRYNTASKRSLEIKNEAFLEAEKWAAKNLKTPYYVERDQYVELAPDEDDPLAVVYGFQIFKEKPDYNVYETYATNLGMVHVRYQSDQHTFSDIHRTEAQ